MDQQQVASAGQKLTPCDVAALQKCLKENKGDRAKCEKEVLAFQQACSAPPGRIQMSDNKLVAKVMTVSTATGASQEW